MLYLNSFYVYTTQTVADLREGRWGNRPPPLWADEDFLTDTYNAVIVYFTDSGFSYQFIDT